MTQYGRDVAGTITARADSSPCADRGQNVVAAFKWHQGGKAGGVGLDEEVSPTCTAVAVAAVVYQKTMRAHEQTITVIDRAAYNQGANARFAPHIEQTDVMDKLVARGPHAVGVDTPTRKYIVRRLTPLECERLQGFPDGWTDIEFRGKPAADAPRYKALGNSMAVPVMRWLGERIQIVDDCASRRSPTF